MKTVDVKIERWILLRENGDAEDVLSLRVRNWGPDPVGIGQGLAFKFTDEQTEFQGAFENGVPRPDPIVEPGAGIETVLFNACAELEPGGESSFAVRSARREMATVTPEHVAFRDTALLLPADLFEARKVEHIVHLVLPESPVRRRVEGTAVAGFTSRTATWEFAGDDNSSRTLGLSASAELLSVAPRLLDDAIAQVLVLQAEIMVGASVDLRLLRSLVQQAGGEFPLDPPVAFPQDDEFDAAPLSERMQALRDLGGVLREVRANLLNSNPPPVAAAAIERGLGVQIAREIQSELTDRQLSQGLPSDTFPVVATLLSYLVAQRRAPDSWPIGVKEKGFQNRLHQFLVARGPMVEREVQSANGRMDFLLGNCPVELKTRDLGNSPLTAILRHADQAAEYAASRSSPLAFLVVLDKHRYEKGAHLPHVVDLVRVLPTESRPGLRGRSTTLVVAMVVLAFPPKPSTLGVVPSSRRRRTSTHPRGRGAVPPP